MRLFTGIEIPDQTRDALERFLARVRPTAHLIWTPVNNLHVTTKFIGEWPEPDLPRLTSALESVQAAGPIAVSIRGVGWFPGPRRPHVFWAGVEAAPELARLAEDTGNALEPLGIAREERGYAPHLTLARIRRPVPLKTLRDAIVEAGSLEFGSFETDRFHLYQSRPGATGTVYVQLSEFRFTTA